MDNNTQQEENKVIKNVLKEVHEKWEMVVFVCSAIVAILLFLIKLFTYAYTKAYYDFWNIPTEYLEMKNDNLIYDFFVKVLIALVIFVLSKGYSDVIINNFKLKKYVKVIAWISIVTIIIYLFFVISLIQTGYNITIVFKYIFFDDPVTILSYTIITSLLIHIIVFAIYLIEQGTKDIITTFKDISKNLNLKIIILGLVVLGISLLFGYFWIYNIRLDACQDGKEIEVVTIDNKEYAVITKYNDKWIIKNCKMDGELLYINSDKYYIDDITSYQIQHYENKISNKDCLLTNNEFEE